MRKLSLLFFVFVMSGSVFLSGFGNSSLDHFATVGSKELSSEIDFFNNMGVGQDISDQEAKEIANNIDKKIKSISAEFDKKKLGEYLYSLDNETLKKNFWGFINKHFPLKSTKINTLQHSKFEQASRGKKLIYFAVPRSKGPEYVVEKMKSCECLPYFYKKSSDVTKAGVPIDASAENLLSTGNSEKQFCLTAFYDPAKAKFASKVSCSHKIASDGFYSMLKGPNYLDVPVLYGRVMPADLAIVQLRNAPKVQPEAYAKELKNYSYPSSESEVSAYPTCIINNFDALTFDEQKEEINNNYKISAKELFNSGRGVKTYDNQEDIVKAVVEESVHMGDGLFVCMGRYFGWTPEVGLVWKLDKKGNIKFVGRVHTSLETGNNLEQVKDLDAKIEKAFNIKLKSIKP